MLFFCAAQSSAQDGSANSGQQAGSAKNSTTCRVGLKSIVVPAPADLQETGPDFRVLLEHDAPDSNRLVAAFLPAQDVARLPSGPEHGFAHYALLETLRQAEFVSVDEATFKQAEDAVAKQYGTIVDAPVMDFKEIAAEFNHKIKAEGSTTEISLNKPVLLGTFFSKPNAFGFGMTMDVAGGTRTQKMIMGSALIRAQSRLLYLFVYAQYTGDDSLAWIRNTTEQWADAILKANTQ